MSLHTTETALDMLSVPVNDLQGAALAYAVAMAEGLGETLTWYFKEDGTFGNIWTDDHGCYRPDDLWDLGGSLIDQHKPFMSPPTGVDENDQPYGWDAEIYDSTGSEVIGHAIGCPTPLVAVCRAVVLAKLGVTVNIPAELVQAVQP